LTSRRPESSWSIFLPVALLVLFLDQASKWFIVSGVWGGPVIPGFLDFTPVTNPGAAFGLLPGARGFFIAVKALALVIILNLVHRDRTGEGGWMVVPLAMIFGGALGNLIDRFRGTGEVVDFVDFHVAGHHWYIWNVADAAVSVGAVLVALRLIFVHRREAAEPPVAD